MACSRAACAMPTEMAPTIGRAFSKVSIAIRNPIPFLPTRAVAGTKQSSRMISDVADALIPILSSSLPMFGIATIFAFVVMYDATGVRRAAGKQAKILNKIVNTPGLTKEQVSEKLVETLGHTPVQVFVGAAIGIISGLMF